jgi:hypothetical protein
MSPDGVRVEHVVVHLHLDRPRRTLLRVTRGTYTSLTAPPSRTSLDTSTWRP